MRTQSLSMNILAMTTLTILRSSTIAMKDSGPAMHT